jgi:dihydrofolate reductase
VSKIRCYISMSLDGFVAGPDATPEEPLGIGGERLHEWTLPLAAWRAPHGLPGGEVNESNAVVEAVKANIGATVMGRNMFGGGPGPWDAAHPWIGWWGTDPPFHHPVFVLTHHPREPLNLDGGTTVTFVTDGLASALDQAREAAGGRDVSVAGGANAIQQCLAAGQVDELVLHLVPILLGGGERLFEAVGDDLHGLELVRTVPTPHVVHLMFARR